MPRPVVAFFSGEFYSGFEFGFGRGRIVIEQKPNVNDIDRRWDEREIISNG